MESINSFVAEVWLIGTKAVAFGRGLLGTKAKFEKMSLKALMLCLLSIASRLMLLRLTFSWAFWQVLCSLVYCFYSIFWAFFIWALRAGLILSLLIIYNFLNGVICKASTSTRSSILFKFLDMQAAFKTSFLLALVARSSRFPWKLDQHKQTKISSTHSSKSGHWDKIGDRLALWLNFLPRFARLTKHGLEINSLSGISSSTLSTSHKAFDLAFLHYLSLVVV